MTRENKLALVVGFGLILFVGILISDHFSTVRSQRPANLTTTTPVSIDESFADGRVNDPNLIELMPFATPTPAMNTGTMTASNITEAARHEHVNNILPGVLPGPAAPGEDVRIMPQGGTQHSPTSVPGFVPAPPEPNAIPVKLHEIRDGETLYAICRKYYGDASRMSALAKYNDLSDPAALASGRKLQIPPIEAIGGKPLEPKNSKTAPSAPPPVTPSMKLVKETSAPATKSPSRANTYTVKSGDSLARIAQKHYGSKAKWTKIYDLNRDVIDDPDNVKPGTVLKL